MSARRIPGRPTTCRRCRRQILFATTMAGPNGPGGKAMPLDVFEDPDGNTAVRPAHGGRLLARVLGKDEEHDPPREYLGMPHFATCAGSPTGDNPRLPADVVDFTARRNQRGPVRR